MRIAEADPKHPETRALIEFHLRDMQAASPPGTSFALDSRGLEGPDVTLLGAWEGHRLVGIGALKRLSPRRAELKSMRTHPDHLGKGVARAILAALIDHAERMGLAVVSLETGTGPAFEPAIALYTGRGFAPGEPFADYANGPYNQCYHFPLATS